ncbi:MAG TPA: class I SAM-dependent methyltransferase [Candidatus Limnocylindrales bacterium]|nr:class I SAM-dependent methyltransferase [Candidatus Limnocylindrales bacterium]
MRDPGSYRDPSGFIFRREGVLYRQVNRSFAEEWSAFLASGLYRDLTEHGLLVRHEPESKALALSGDAEAVIRPHEIRFISYPYEWSFTQLRDAALMTLEIQERALARGQILRDATPFNVQFEGSAPIWIDTLSFAPLEVARPWPAYRQFCEGFLAPLALMAYRDPRLGLLLADLLDGIPLELASRLMPGRTRFRPGLAAHLHLHAAAQRQARDRRPSSPVGRRTPAMNLTRHRAIVSSLRKAVGSLRTPPKGVWEEYTRVTSYSDAAARSKAALVDELLKGSEGRTVLDAGANDGTFSQMAASQGRDVVALDSDRGSIDALYRHLRDIGQSTVLPLVADIANPSPALGWAGEERRSLLDRLQVDLVLCLALVHHLAIGRNVPLPMIFDVFARLGRHVILEWVPKEDPMAQYLLAGRWDVFPTYTIDGLRRAASSRFTIVRESPIDDSARVLLNLERTT